MGDTTTPETTPEKSLLAEEVAKAIGRCKHTVLRWAQSDLIRCDRRNARFIFFKLSEVKADMKAKGLKEGKGKL